VTTIFLFRHGQTDWNREGRIQGHLDVPLNDFGRSQARALIAPLRRLSIESILSSDLSRARETAEIIAQTLGLPMALDEGLREIHLGKIEGLTRTEIISRFGTEFSDRIGGSHSSRPLSDSDVAFLGAESGDAVTSRALVAIETYIGRSGHQRIAVATHGGVIRRLIQFSGLDEILPAPVFNGVLFPLILVREPRSWKLQLFISWGPG